MNLYDIRKTLEDLELNTLHPKAAKSIDAKRDIEEKECSIRTKFQEIEIEFYIVNHLED